MDKVTLRTGALVLVGVGAAGALYLLARGRRAALAPPAPKLQPLPGGLLKPGLLKPETMLLKQTIWQPRTPLPQYDTPPRTPAEIGNRQRALKQLRPDASTWADGYSQHRWATTQATWSNGATAGFYTDAEIAAYNKGRTWTSQMQKGLSWGLTDEYGRAVRGVPGDPLGALLQAYGIAAPFIPGIGPLAASAIAAAIALGQGKSLKEALIAAVRANLPGGPLAQMGFDVAVAAASGEAVDGVVLNAFFEKYPQAKTGYEVGMQAWKARDA